MFTTKRSVALLPLICLGLTLALPSEIAKKQDSPPSSSSSVEQDNSVNDAGQGRTLAPVLFGTKKKIFTVGTGGIGTFFRAWRNCIEEGKSLATINTPEEHARLTSMIANHDTNYWIGATSLGSASARLIWVTTDLPVKTSLLNAAGLDLSGIGASTSYCISLTPTGSWSASNCFLPTNALPYLCEEYV